MEPANHNPGKEFAVRADHLAVRRVAFFSFQTKMSLVPSLPFLFSSDNETTINLPYIITGFDCYNVLQKISKHQWLNHIEYKAYM